MKVHTQEWGTLEVREEQTVHFPDGLLGFEELHGFVLLEIEECRPFLWLLSMDEPGVSFALAEPRFFQSGDYRVHLSSTDEERLQLAEGDTLGIFVIVTADPQRGVAANLRGPIVMNMRNRLARQVITYGAGLTLRQPLCVGQEVPAAFAEVAGNRI
ncbi:MAG: flagellar assembly protein FliW [Candidatus Eisenbacteria bacterium]